MIERIASVLKTENAKNMGYTNIAQFTDIVLREAVKDLERSLSHVNCYEDHVKILDKDLEGRGRIVSVYFKEEGPPYCDYCEEHDCVHVQYAWEIPEAREPLLRRGLKPPPSRRVP